MFKVIMVLLILTLFRALYQSIKVFYKIQFIEKLKYEESAKERSDIGTSRAIDIWCKRGYDNKFNGLFFKHFLILLKYKNSKEKIENVYKLYRISVNDKK